MRIRHVYPTVEIAHKWAHQTQADARNGQGNLFFEGPTIYSYRQSWPLARIYTNTAAYTLADNPETKLVLTNSSRYSSTTNRHQWSVLRAIPDGVRHIACPNPAPNYSWDQDLAIARDKHNDNLKYFTKEITSRFDKASRRMIYSRAKWDAKEAARKRHVEELRRSPHTCPRCGLEHHP